MSGAEATHPQEPIAIIGIGCRFPGGVVDLDTFWKLLRDGVDAITEIPSSRFDIDAFYDARPATPGKIMTRYGGFLEHIEEMDAYFFGVAPREAERMDPQQRLLLEVAWEAFENAGQPVDQILGSQTGVFIGQWLNDYEARLFADPTRADFYMTTGSGRYSSAGRLSYQFGLQGPSLTVDTHCSSSLVAVHLACQSLRAGESRLALAGAANLILQPQISIAYSQSKMLAPDGRCKFGDARANGYVRSEGVAAVVLKRLSDALADGDPIHAVILGSAVNNDGQSSGFLSTPGGAGQEELLRKAYRNAGIAPGQVQYVEAHGTGTPAGDPVEINALAAVLAEGRAPEEKCRIGSVKSNFGHTEGAAGLAGLIKTVLALRHEQLPPSLHYETPNPALDWERLPLQVQTGLENWPAHAGPALAGVSSFGIAGTNAHLVLQQAPAVGPVEPAPEPAQRVLPLSARSPEALRATAARMAALLEQDQPPLIDLLYTAARRRTHHAHRLAVTAAERAALSAALRDFAQGEPLAPVITGESENPRKIIFVFPGQGGQWLGMGRQLYQEDPVFRAVIDQCACAFQPFADWSLVEQIFAGAEDSRFAEIDVIQPALFAVEVGLAESLRARGVEPNAVVGHSMGEVAAAYIAGALNLEDAARVICMRSRLMKRVSGHGAMAVVDLTRAQAEAAIADFPGQLAIAVNNGPHASVLSGDLAALETVTTRLKQQGVFTRPVKVDIAAHSPHMDALRPELEAALAGIRPQSPAIPMFSTVTAGWVDFPLDSGYWGRNLRQPVLFGEAVSTLLAEEYSLFVECSPHPILLAAIEQNLVEASSAGLATIAAGRRDTDERSTLQSAVEQAYAQGGNLRWERLYPHGYLVDLPAYPWQRERYWAKEAELRKGGSPTQAAGRLPGERIETPAMPGVTLWQSRISLDAFPYLGEYVIDGEALLPAAMFACLALEATGALQPGAGLADITILAPMPINAGESHTVQVVFQPGGAFAILSRQDGMDEWRTHAQGKLDATPAKEPAQAMPAAPETMQPGLEHLAAMRARGLQVGPAFQAVESSMRDAGYAWLRLPAELASGQDWQIHPALLDAVFQQINAAVDMDTSRGDPFLPAQIAALQVVNRPRRDARILAVAGPVAWMDADTMVCDVTGYDEQGLAVLLVRGAQMRRIPRRKPPEGQPGESAPAGLGLRARILAAQAGRARRAVVEQFIQEQAATVLRLPIARVDAHKPLRSLGLDSLMGVELRNRLESALELPLSATLVWNYPTVHDLAPFLAEKLGISLEETPVGPPAAAPAPDEKPLDDLSTEDLAALLDDELKSLGNIL